MHPQLPIFWQSHKCPTLRHIAFFALIAGFAVTVHCMSNLEIARVPEIRSLDRPRLVQSVSLLSNATLVHTTVDPMDNNCWFLVSPSGDALLIDAEHLLRITEEMQFRITDVLTTHRHGDHVQALEDVLRETGARHHAGRNDAQALPAHVNETYGHDSGEPEPLRTAGDLGVFALQVVEVRGHTPGGIAVLATNSDNVRPGRVFVGDSLFPGGVGKTNNPEEFEQLLGDVVSRILTLPEDTIVHPGHGDSTTVGEELPHVEQWRERGW